MTNRFSHYETIKILSELWKESGFIDDIRIFCPDDMIEITCSPEITKYIIIDKYEF